MSLASDRLHMPSLGGAVAWLNSEPLEPAALRGRVVLVDFWTFTCINWLRTEPYLRAWSRAYADDGLLVLGVHTPEFSFEHDLDRVRTATRQREIDYPVLIDNDYAVWDAFANSYWPALYFVDADGLIRDSHFGEGRYEQSERVIQELLGLNRDLVPVSGSGVEAEADWEHLRTPETYVGYRRGERFASAATADLDRRASYARPERLQLNQWALDGDWTIGPEAAVLDRPGGSIAYRFSARDAHLVLSLRGGSADPVPGAPRRGGARPVARRRRRRGRERRPLRRPPLSAHPRARRHGRADAGDRVRRARGRGVRLHLRLSRSSAHRFVSGWRPRRGRRAGTPRPARPPSGGSSRH